MEKNMLKKEDKIFKNLYNELGWEIESSIKREDWLIYLPTYQK